MQFQFKVSCRRSRILAHIDLSGRYHNVSEDTHWGGYLNASINYIRLKYPPPWDTVSICFIVTQLFEDLLGACAHPHPHVCVCVCVLTCIPVFQETQKFVVFLLGVVSHQVSDISWHSLGIDQGFIRTMSKVSVLQRAEFVQNGVTRFFSTGSDTQSKIDSSFQTECYSCR